MDGTQGETMQRWLAVIVAFVLAGCATVTPADAQSPAGEPPLIAGRVAVAGLQQRMGGAAVVVALIALQ